MNTTWTISQIDQSFVNGVLTPSTAHWQCTLQENNESVSVYATASLFGLTDLSVDSVFAHIWANGVDKQATEQSCVNQMAQKKATANSLRLNQMVSTKPPETPIDKAKADAHKQIDDHHEMVISNLVGNPTQAEKHTWTVKLDTATAVVEGRTPSVAGREFLKSAKIATDEEKAAWAKVVLYKAGAYAHVIGVGEHLRSEARKKMHLAETVEQVKHALEESITLAQSAVETCISH